MMNYSKLKIEVQQKGKANKCELRLIGIERKEDKELLYVLEATVYKESDHFPSVPIFGSSSPFFIEGGVSTINPILTPVNGHKVRCEVKSNNSQAPTITVGSDWEMATATDKPLKLPTETKELPSLIIDDITDNPVEVVICMDISGSMKEAFKKGDIHSKMDMANRSAMAFIHKLRSNVDFLGICSFSSNAHHVWGAGEKTQFLDDNTLELAEKAIRKLKSDGGGTYMADGLKRAGAMLSDSPSSRKTIILLSDGLDSTKAPDEIQKADELKKEGIEIYTIAVGSDADIENLKKIAGGSSSDVKYALIVSSSSIEMDSAFTHIIHELGVSTVHLNEIIKAKSGQAISNIYPLQDYIIPKGADKAYASFIWDNHSTYKWIGFDDPSYPFPAKAGDISFSVTKRGENGKDGILVDKSDMSIVKNEDGYVVLTFKNVEEGDKYEFGLFKKTKDDKHLNFSVSFYTPQAPADGLKASKDDLLKIYGMTPKIVSLLETEGITSFTNIIDVEINHIFELLARHMVLLPDYQTLIFDTWQQQASLAANKDWTTLDKMVKELEKSFPKDTLFLPR